MNLKIEQVSPGRSLYSDMFRSRGEHTLLQLQFSRCTLGVVMIILTRQHDSVTNVLIKYF